MTIITGKEFRTNQSKYIDLAHSGEEVVLTTKAGSVKLTPVSEDDKIFDDYTQSAAFLAIAQKARSEHKEGKTLHFENAVNAQRWMDEL